MPERIAVNGGALAYDVYGTGGRSVVALPGIGDSRASYRQLGPLLAAAGFTVYALDLRGHGGSDAGFESYTAADVGDDAVAVMEALDLQEVVLLGNSIGAASGAHAALKSERVTRLVFLSGFVDDPPNFGWMRPLLMLLFAWPWGVWVWGQYRNTLFETLPSDHAEHQARLLANLRESGRLRAVRAMMCASKAATAARLSEVMVPTLIAMGAQDPDFTDPVAEAERQSHLLGGQNRVAMIEQAGHYPQIERPEETARVVLEFLKEG